jgi:hypothetical protein
VVAMTFVIARTVTFVIPGEVLGLSIDELLVSGITETRGRLRELSMSSSR